jgi:hypothetical protein
LSVRLCPLFASQWTLPASAAWCQGERRFARSTLSIFIRFFMVSLRSKGRLPFKHWHRFSSLPERNSIWKSLLCACRRHQRCLIGNGDFGTSPPFGSSQASKALDRVNTILSGASLIGAGVTRSYSGSSQGLGRINPRRTFREERQCRLRCGSSHGIESKIGPSGVSFANSREAIRSG